MQITVKDATEAFEEAYKIVQKDGEIVESRLGKAKHLTGVTVTVENPYQHVCMSPHRNMSVKYLIAEHMWYFSGSNKVKDIAPYAKMWNSLTDDGETLNSAYGYRIFHKFGFNQLKYCVEKLRANLYDRQAVIHIKEASNKPTKDTPCTCLLQFTCFKGKLNLQTYMRSNDIWLGLPYDIAFFMTLQQIVACAVGIPCGVYEHTVGDLHLYEKHWGELPPRQEKLALDEGWDYTMETEESLERILQGEAPENLLLRELWRMNKYGKKK